MGSFDVEIFRPGKWNGDTYTADDLAAMHLPDPGDSFAPLKITHEDQPALSKKASFGRIAKLWTDGKGAAMRLIARVEDVPDAVMSLIRDRLYRAVSVELRRVGGKAGKYSLVSALALLGAQKQAVAGLFDGFKFEEVPTVDGEPITVEFYAREATNLDETPHTDCDTPLETAGPDEGTREPEGVETEPANHNTEPLQEADMADDNTELQAKLDAAEKAREAAEKELADIKRVSARKAFSDHLESDPAKYPPAIHAVAMEFADKMLDIQSQLPKEFSEGGETSLLRCFQNLTDAWANAAPALPTKDVPDGTPNPDPEEKDTQTFKDEDGNDIEIPNEVVTEFKEMERSFPGLTVVDWFLHGREGK